MYRITRYLRGRGGLAIVLRVRTTTVKTSTYKTRKRSKLGKDKRRKHRHWQVTIYYHDGEKFARVYIDREKAARFADRQKRSPIVRATRVTQLV